jgi:N-acetyl-alpha-D-muramate 1-phosphate uridylyltransferase
MMLPVAILAGGLATRLRPVTETIPKALIPVAGQPFIARQLRYLRGQGIVRVVICTGHLGEQIEKYVGTGRAFDVEVAYSADGPTLLGTGGALRQAVPLLGDAFFVLYGDSYLPCRFDRVERAWHASGAPALMTVLRNAGRWDRSNVLFRDGLVVEYNKLAPRPEMDWIDYGLSVITPAALDEHPAPGAFDLGDVFHGLSLAGRLAGCEVTERFYEIGSPQGLQAAETYFSRREPA